MSSMGVPRPGIVPRRDRHDRRAAGESCSPRGLVATDLEGASMVSRVTWLCKLNRDSVTPPGFTGETETHPGSRQGLQRGAELQPSVLGIALDERRCAGR